MWSGHFLVKVCSNVSTPKVGHTPPKNFAIYHQLLVASETLQFNSLRITKILRSFLKTDMWDVTAIKYTWSWHAQSTHWTVSYVMIHAIRSLPNQVLNWKNWSSFGLTLVDLPYPVLMDFVCCQWFIDVGKRYAQCYGACVLIVRTFKIR